MTPIPPSSSDGSALPPRHRPNLGNLAKDTTEQDLWAFDDIDSQGEEITAAPPKSSEPVIPVPRDSEKIKVTQPRDQATSKPGGNQDSIQVNVGKNRPKLQPGLSTGQSQPGSEFDDLDHWDEPVAAPQGSPPVKTGAISSMPTPPAPVEARAFTVRQADPLDEFSPPRRDNASPVSLRPRLNLTHLERVGLIALAVLLLLGGAMVFLNTINRLPTSSGRAKANDFPIRGSHLTIISANSFWRVPKAADTVRRGTQLIPVVDLTTSGGPGAIRAFFRNSDGEVIGDAVTRYVKSDGTLQIAATAGFDDVGMHAAYRTGDNKPWTIEVLEAATESAPGPEFEKLFEIGVSADRR